RGATAVAAAYMAYRVHVTVSSHRAAVVQALATPKVQTQLITSASQPGKASAPDPVIDVIAGLIVGFIAGLGVAFVTDRFGKRLRGVRRWQEATGGSVLARLWRRRPIDSSAEDQDAPTALALRYPRMRTSQSVHA